MSPKLPYVGFTLRHQRIVWKFKHDASIMSVLLSSYTEWTLIPVGLVHALTELRMRRVFLSPPSIYSVANENRDWLFLCEEKKSLNHNNNLLSRKPDLAVSLIFMFLQSCAVKCVTSAQLTFVVIEPWQRRAWETHTWLCIIFL